MPNNLTNVLAGKKLDVKNIVESMTGTAFDKTKGAEVCFGMFLHPEFSNVPYQQFDLSIRGSTQVGINDYMEMEIACWAIRVNDTDEFPGTYKKAKALYDKRVPKGIAPNTLADAITKEEKWNEFQMAAVALQAEQLHYALDTINIAPIVGAKVPSQLYYRRVKLGDRYGNARPDGGNANGQKFVYSFSDTGYIQKAISGLAENYISVWVLGIPGRVNNATWNDEESWPSAIGEWAETKELFAPRPDLNGTVRQLQPVISGLMTLANQQVRIEGNDDDNNAQHQPQDLHVVFKLDSMVVRQARPVDTIVANGG